MRLTWVVLALMVCTQCRQYQYSGSEHRPELMNPSVRPMAPDFHLPTPTGDSLALSSLRGRVVVLNFWATWCKPCLQEMPELEEFHHAMESVGASVVGVSMDFGDLALVNHFLRRLKVEYPVVMANDDMVDAYSQLPARFLTPIPSQSAQTDQAARPNVTTFSALDGLPTTMVIDQQGRIAASHLGLLDMEELKSAVSHLLYSPTG